jgi:predicted permease
MTDNPDPSGNVPVSYRLLAGWMRILARFVPSANRDRWCTEWDGEMWYGVAGRLGAQRRRIALALCVGMLRDVLEVRRLRKAQTRSLNRPRNEPVRSLFHERGLGTRVRQTLRRLAHEWHYSAGVVLILGIGIGPAAVGLSVLDAVLLEPLPFEEPERIGVVRISSGELVNHPGLDANEVFDLQQSAGAFEAVEWFGCYPVWIGVGDEIVPVSGAASVSTGLFDLLGVSPKMGRTFVSEDGIPGENEPRTLIISHRVWRTHFSEDPDVLGRAVSVEGNPHEVVGVLPPDFRLSLESGSDVPRDIDLWRPSVIQSANPGREFFRFANTLVRLKDGVDFPQANTFLEAFARREREMYPAAYGNSPARFTVSPILEDLLSDSKPAIVAAVVGVLLLLVTATVNASALLVVGQRRRARELAVRAAIGAGRRRLLTDVFVELLLLWCAGFALGTGIAVWCLSGTRRLLPPEVPRLENLSLDWEGVLLAGCSAIVLILPILVTALWRLMRGTPWKRLSGGSDRTSTPHAAGHSILVGAQVVMAVVLLFGAVQLARSALELATTDLGFDPHHTIALETPLYGAGLSIEERNVRYTQIRDHLTRLPGVVAVGGISNPPLHGTGTISTFYRTGMQSEYGVGEHQANFYAVIPGYFSSVGNSVIRGRDFTDLENLEGLPVAIIDETLAEVAFPGQDPIGQTIGAAVLASEGPTTAPDPTIVGVVAHSRIIDPTEEVRPQVFLPYGFWNWGPQYLTIRTVGGPALVLPEAREVVRELGTGHPVLQVDILAENLGAATSVLRAVTILVVALALSAAFLASLGLYAAVSYIVIQQRRATAIRSVLGASPGILFREQLRRVLLILLAATPAGIVVAIVGARLLESLVYNVAVRDVGSLAIAAFVGVAACLLAATLPARRAANADLRVALEED